VAAHTAGNTADIVADTVDGMVVDTVVDTAAEVAVDTAAETVEHDNTAHYAVRQQVPEQLMQQPLLLPDCPRFGIHNITNHFFGKIDRQKLHNLTVNQFSDNHLNATFTILSPLGNSASGTAASNVMETLSEAKYLFSVKHRRH